MRRISSRGVTVGALTTLLLTGILTSGCGGSSLAQPETPASTAGAAVAAETSLSTLIEAENAAIYAYGVIGAHLTGAPRSRALAALKAHRQLRDAWISAAQAAEQKIPPAAIAYDLPIDVRGRATAEALLIEIEERLIAVYESAGEIAAPALTQARERLQRIAASQ
jgi:hypothetical protein